MHCRLATIGPDNNHREPTRPQSSKILLTIAALFFTIVAIASTPGIFGVSGKFSFAAKWMHQISDFLTFEGSLAITIVGGISALLDIAITGYLLFKFFNEYSQPKRGWEQVAPEWHPPTPAVRNHREELHNEPLSGLRLNLSRYIPRGFNPIRRQEDNAPDDIQQQIADPISAAPIEIVYKIFEFLSPPHTEVRELLPLRLTCRLFKQVIDESVFRDFDLRNYVDTQTAFTRLAKRKFKAAVGRERKVDVPAQSKFQFQDRQGKYYFLNSEKKLLTIFEPSVCLSHQIAKEQTILHCMSHEETLMILQATGLELWCFNQEGDPRCSKQLAFPDEFKIEEKDFDHCTHIILKDFLFLFGSKCLCLNLKTFEWKSQPPLTSTLSIGLFSLGASLYTHEIHANGKSTTVKEYSLQPSGELCFQKKHDYNVHGMNPSLLDFAPFKSKALAFNCPIEGQHKLFANLDEVKTETDRSSASIFHFSLLPIFRSGYVLIGLIIARCDVEEEYYEAAALFNNTKMYRHSEGIIYEAGKKAPQEPIVSVYSFVPFFIDAAGKTHNQELAKVLKLFKISKDNLLVSLHIQCRNNNFIMRALCISQTNKYSFREIKI